MALIDWFPSVYGQMQLLELETQLHLKLADSRLAVAKEKRELEERKVKALETIAKNIKRKKR